jgi:hypothetical protein
MPSQRNLEVGGLAKRAAKKATEPGKTTATSRLENRRYLLLLRRKVKE